MSFKQIPFGSAPEFNAIIEIPKGDSNKYEYDEELDIIKLDWVFTADFKMPFDYGYIPQTLGGDGDALDVYVINDHPLGIGALVACRPLGIIKLLDRGEVDDKIIALPLANPRYKNYQKIEDFEFDVRGILEKFFIELGKQKNKILEVKGFFGAEEAIKELQAAHASFLSKQ
jgi:inorganic pyrophosphatase